MEWTDAARAELDEHCRRYREVLRAAPSAAGADPDEVVEDVRRHVHEELGSSEAGAITPAHVREVLGRLGVRVPEAARERAAAAPSDPAAVVDAGTARDPSRTRAAAYAGASASLVVVLAGIFLPLLTLFVELATRMCRGSFLDPLPSPAHAFLIALVPLSNALGSFASNTRSARARTSFGALNSAALVVCAYYSLLFLPLLPLAVPGILLAGLGLLPLSPYFALAATWITRRRLRVADPSGGAGRARARVPGTAAGVVLALTALFAVHVPEAVAEIGLRMASADEPERRAQGLRWLRNYASERALLERCYRLPPGPVALGSKLFGRADRPGVDQARAAYYRVTGRPFNTEAPPRWKLGEGWSDAPLSEQWARFDPEQGAAAVGGVLPGLELASSRMDGFVEPAPALAYLEWTLLFRNRSVFQREARAELLLPPGAVVSRLTLWIDGEEREAAFAGRAQTREAYQSVVQARRDPVLVTTSGPDRVLVQCFPVPPNGGEMQARIGMTIPLELPGLDRAHLRLPRIAERNFAVELGASHAVWLESAVPLSAVADALVLNPNGDGNFALRGQLGDAALQAGAGSIAVERGSGVFGALETWVEDPCPGKGPLVLQTLRETPLPPPSCAIVVVDGSAGLAPRADELAGAFASLPEGLDFALVTALDAAHTAIPRQRGTAALYREASEVVRELAYEGGRDSVPALAAALQLAGPDERALIVWIHGAQPVLLDPVAPLEQYLERSRSRARIAEFAAVVGPNRILRELDARDVFAPAPETGALGTDLASLFASLGGGSARVQRSFERVPHGSLSAAASERAPSSRNLARLWALAEIEGLCRRLGDAPRNEAVALAARYQLVTPVSGAVVLENAQQYAQAGLDPVDADSVPTVPEPELIGLIAVAALVLAFAAYRRMGGAA